MFGRWKKSLGISKESRINALLTASAPASPTGCQGCPSHPPAKQLSPFMDLKGHRIPGEGGPSTQSPPYLVLVRGRGWGSRLHTTRGGGNPWASQGRVVSCPSTARMDTGSDVCDPFTLILGFAAWRGSTAGAGTLQVPHSPHCSSSHPPDPSGTWTGTPRKPGVLPGHSLSLPVPSGAVLSTHC